MTQLFPPEFEGGTEALVRSQASALARRGHDVRVVSGTDHVHEGRDLGFDRQGALEVVRVPRRMSERSPFAHARPRVEELVQWAVDGADAVHVHHWATLHGSRGNRSATRTRRAASIRYALDGCFFYKRPSSPEPFRNTVGIADGAPLESAPRFPVVWPRDVSA